MKNKFFSLLLLMAGLLLVLYMAFVFFIPRTQSIALGHGCPCNICCMRSIYNTCTPPMDVGRDA